LHGVSTTPLATRDYDDGLHNGSLDIALKRYFLRDDIGRDPCRQLAGFAMH
jgi:hypothetical protein